MKVLVIYESMFGNTAAIGEEVAASLRSHGLEVDSGPLSGVRAAMLFNQGDERGRLVGRAWGRRRLAAARGEQQGQHEQDGSNAD